MTGWKLKTAKLAAMVGLLIAGIGVSAALADPGNGNGNGNGATTTVPGSPGDDCSHGNNGKDCRPDPNENGKDCDDHGNASGNEDHCAPVETTTTTTTTDPTTTTESTPTTTTTTSSTTTSSTPPTNGTPPPSSQGNPSTPPASGPPSSSSSGGTSSASTSPVTKAELQKELAQQVKGLKAGPSSHTAARTGELPFTGFPAWALALIGSMLLVAGLGLRKLTS
jgi:hypothetical protein